MHALDKDVPQCKQANHALGKQNCPCNRCSSGGGSLLCNRSGEPDFDEFGFECARRKGALSWEELKQQLSPAPCLNSPVVFGWQWTGDRIGRHMMVAYGYEEIDGQRWVLIVDPQDPAHSCRHQYDRITYERYVAGSDHKHTQDVHNVRKANR